MNMRLLIPLAAGLVLAPAALSQPAGFPSYGGMIAQMQTAANNFPAICQAVNITQKYGLARTWQGQDIWGVKISDNVTQEEDEPAFLMVANHHGNEYGTPIIALDTLSRLTTGYATNAQIRSYVDNNEIWILPTCNPDGYWTSRHNRNPSGSVDLNRNYPFSWGSPCNSGVRGSGPGSEPETQTVMALSEDQRFTKVIDFHTSGRETLYAYRQGCPNHQLLNFLRDEAIAISQASSYGGAVRGPSSDGEHYQHQLGTYSNYAFLTETNTTHSPSITSANNEAARVWPGTVYILERAIPISGHITDAATGDPIEAQISYVENPFTKGEQNRSEPRFGRYHAWLPTGPHTLRIEHPCYLTQTVLVDVPAGGVVRDIQLTRDPNAPTGAATVYNGVNVNPICLASLNAPVAGADWNLRVDATGVPLATSVLVAGYERTLNGPVFPQGQVLLALGTQRLVWINQTLQAGIANVSIPLASGLIGSTGAIQAILIRGEAFVQACNALSYTVGCN